MKETVSFQSSFVFDKTNKSLSKEINSKTVFIANVNLQISLKEKLNLKIIAVK
jgi:hypothetical protein